MFEGVNVMNINTFTVFTRFHFNTSTLSHLTQLLLPALKTVVSGSFVKVNRGAVLGISVVILFANAHIAALLLGAGGALSARSKTCGGN